MQWTLLFRNLGRRRRLFFEYRQVLVCRPDRWSLLSNTDVGQYAATAAAASTAAAAAAAAESERRLPKPSQNSFRSRARSIFTRLDNGTRPVTTTSSKTSEKQIVVRRDLEMALRMDYRSTLSRLKHFSDLTLTHRQSLLHL
jgi:hypothetical protein